MTGTARSFTPAEVRAALSRTAACYRPCGARAHAYVASKFVYDVVYRQVAERAPFESPVVDFSCGRGQTLLLCAQLQPGLAGVGIDWDEDKLVLARRAAAGFQALRFEHGDARTCAIPPARTLFMLDVLHYHPREVQDAILRRAAQALLPGGVLYFRDVDDARGWRASVNRWQERINRGLSWNKSALLCFRPMREVEALFAAEGLSVASTPSWGAMPLANVLLEVRRA